jgi:hypothetical protein
MSEPAMPSIPPPPGAPAGPALPEETPHRLSHRVAGLACPNCGGALEVESGLRVVTCPFCGTPLLALAELGVRRFAIEPQIDAARARQIARSWLGRGIRKDRRLRREAEVGEAFLSFLPFFRVEADCVGVALGTELRRRTVGSGNNRRTETYEVAVERKAGRSFDRTYPALNVAEWGIRKVDLVGDPLIPFDADALDRLGMVFPPTGSERLVRDAAVESFKREADPARGLHRVSFRFLDSLRERLSVVYYPLWVVRYRFRERSYQALIDAEDGSLAFGKAPGNDLYRALMLVTTEAAALYVATTAVQVSGSPGVLFVLGGLMLALLIWGWKRFRYGGVVTEGTGIDGAPSLAGSLGRAARKGPGGELARGLIDEVKTGLGR